MDSLDINETFGGIIMTNISTNNAIFTNTNQTYSAKIGFYDLQNGWGVKDKTNNNILFTSDGITDDYNATFLPNVQMQVANDLTINSTTPGETPTSSSGGGIPTYKITQEQLKNGYEKSLRKSWKLKFEIKNETHHLKLDDIKDETATLTISSEPITFDLGVGENKKLDLDKDGFYDLEVFLKDIRGYYVDLVVKLINEKIIFDEIPEEEVAKDVVGENNVGKDVIIKEKSYLWGFALAGLIILLVVGIGVDYLLYRKKKGR